MLESVNNSNVNREMRNEMLTNGMMDPNKVMSPIKPVNLLPEVPTQTSRKLSEREQHDCEVIGTYLNIT